MKNYLFTEDMNTRILSLLIAAPLTLTVCAGNLTRKVTPFLGTSTLWTPQDLGFTHLRDKRPWGGETFPGATTPNGMVQLSPVTKYGSGGGYQYEDRNI